MPVGTSGMALRIVRAFSCSTLLFSGSTVTKWQFKAPSKKRHQASSTFLLDVFSALLPDDVRVEREVGDGNCFFRAIARQQYGDPDLHRRVRKEICDYMAAHPELLQWFLRNDIAAASPDSYILSMRRDRQHGGLEEALYAQLRYNKKVDIVLLEESVRDAGLSWYDTRELCSMHVPPVAPAILNQLFPPGAADAGTFRLVMHVDGYHWDSLTEGTRCLTKVCVVSSMRSSVMCTCFSGQVKLEVHLQVVPILPGYFCYLRDSDSR